MTDEEASSALAALKSQGLTFHQCVWAFGVGRDSDYHARTAFEIYNKDGETEIDSIAVVNRADDGCYVMGWCWVDDPGYESTDP
jgi:hypothetical protein